MAASTTAPMVVPMLVPTPTLTNAARAEIDELFPDPTFIAALYGDDLSILYPEIAAWLARTDALAAEAETRISVPAIDLDAAADDVSVEFGTLDTITGATTHLDLSHGMSDCWTAKADELEKLEEIHRLAHAVCPQDHHHGPAKQPARVLELVARPRDQLGRFTSTRTGGRVS